MQEQTPQPNNLDPQAVMLAQAIRQHESGGNPTAQGKSGEFGAYQYTEPTWQSDSVNAGVNVPLQQATLQQQNQVAYTKIKKLKDEGLNVGQIASEWNSGDPEAYQNPNYKGVNSSGASYDVPAYAKNIATTYQSLKNGQKPPQTPTPQSSNAMPLWEKILFGIGGLGAAAGAIALLPESGGASAELLPEAGALGAEALGTGAEAGGVSSTLGTLAEGALTGQVVNSGVNYVKGLLGGNKTTETPSAPEQPLNIPNNQGAESALQTSNNLTQAITKSAGTTQSGQRILQTPEGQAGVQTIGKYGLAPEINGNGQMIFTQPYADADKRSAELDEAENKILDAEGSHGNVSDVGFKAKEIVRKTLPSTDWEEADAHIDREIHGYQKRMGGNTVGLGSEGIGRIRKEGYKGFDRNASSAKNGARKALGSAANHHILEKTKHKELIARLHKEKQDLIHAKKVMKFLHGKKAIKTNTFLHKYGQAIGAYIGDKIGGGIGAVIGSLVGTHLIKVADKKFGKTEFESPAMQKALEILKHKDSKVYEIVKQKLKQYEIEVKEEKKQKEERMKKGLLLKEPAIRLGSPSQTKTQVLQANKNPVSVNPKTNKFQTSYNSGGKPLSKEELKKKSKGLFNGQAKIK